jgi:hypothetical protein
MGKYEATTQPGIVTDVIGRYGKAFVGAAVAGIAYFLGVLAPEATPADITFVQWLGFALAVLGTGGGVALVPNKAAKPLTD